MGSVAGQKAAYGRMIRGMVLGGAVCGFACGFAVAAQAQTMLSLSATGQADVAPDEMVASLQVQASTPQAAAAQDAVNGAMAKALAMARAVAGVAATTNGYQVFKTTSENAATPPQFQASQNLMLVIPAAEGVPPDRFTALLGRLQQDGLLLNTLEGDLSRAGQARAGQAAIADGIGQIQAQAAMIAARLNMKVGAIKTLDVNASGPVGPAPRVMMSAAMAPPQAAPDRVTVQVNVSAMIALTSAQ
jgi:uncharacterized protein YggE